mgnify:CR=1 FL=1
MQSTLRLTASVLPGKRLEITDPELPDSGTVEVIVMLPEPKTERRSIMEFIDSLPRNPHTPEECAEIERGFVRDE